MMFVAQRAGPWAGLADGKCQARTTGATRPGGGTRDAAAADREL